MVSLSYEQQIEIGYRYVRDHLEPASRTAPCGCAKKVFTHPTEKKNLKRSWMPQHCLYAR